MRETKRVVLTFTELEGELRREMGRDFDPEALRSVVGPLARQGLVVTLFLVGTGRTREVLRRVGVRPLAQGVILWGVVSAALLALISAGIIRS